MQAVNASLFRPRLGPSSSGLIGGSSRCKRLEQILKQGDEKSSEGRKVDAFEEGLGSAACDGEPCARLADEAHNESLRSWRDELGAFRALFPTKKAFKR